MPKQEDLNIPEDDSRETPEQREVSEQLKRISESSEGIEGSEKKYNDVSLEELHQLIGEQLENRQGKSDKLAGKTFEDLYDYLEGRTIIESKYGGYDRLNSNEIIAELRHLQEQAEEELNTKPWEEIMQKLNYFGNSYEPLETGLNALMEKFPELKGMDSTLQSIIHSFEVSILQDRMKREGLTDEDFKKLWDKEQEERYGGKGKEKKKKKWW